LKDVTVSSSGSSTAGVAGGSDSAIGVKVTIDGGTITTTNNGATSIGSTQGAVGIQSIGRTTRVDATDVVVSSNGYAALATSDGAIINFVRGSLTSTAQDATAGSLAGAVVSLAGDARLTDTSVTSSGTNIAGVVSRAVNYVSKATLTGTTVSTSGAGADGLLANGNGANITLLGNNSISTTGAQAHGVRIDGAGATVNFNGSASINTTGAGSDAISVANGASKTFDGSVNNILPTITVAGAGAAVLSADAGMIDLNNTGLNTGMTAGSDTWGIATRNDGYVQLGEGSSTGGTGVWASGSQVIFQTGTDAAGSRIKLDEYGRITIVSDVKTGSLESTSTNSSVYVAGNTLTIGANNAANNGSLVDNANYAGSFSGSSEAGSFDGNGNFVTDKINLIKTGSLNQILSGTGNTVGSVEIQQGRLTFAQPGDFTVAGNLNTASGATLGIGAADTTLQIGGVLTQAAGSRLDAILGASPDIKAGSASLNGDLTISGFNAGAAPTKASDVALNRYNLIATTGGITGNFTNVNSSDGGFIATDGFDYLNSYGFVTNAGKNYELGFDLAWTSARDASRTGSFTMAAGTTFDVDIALGNQAASALTGWDGKTLTKNGEGLLQLSAVNIYTGDTVLNGGVLKLNGAGDISSSSALTINGGQFDISSASGNRTVNNLSGSTGSKVTLGGNTLTANNTQSGTYAGVIEGTAGGFTKAGAGTLTLTGDNTYTGNTTVDQGILQLGAGGTTGSVAGNIVLNNGTTLVANRSNDFTLAGTFSGQGDLKQVGTGTLTLTGLSSSVGNVDIQQGKLTFAQKGDFTVAGNLNTASGATLGIGAKDATLKINGVFTQAAGNHLDAILGASPDITAGSATLNGDLTISGFNAGTLPAKASDVEVNRYTMLATTGGITGNFTNVNSADGGFIATDGLDYLNSYGFVTNAGKNYELGFDMAWTSARDASRTGSFTMAAGTTFDVDIALGNQAASALTGWDGKTLTKNGEGLLQLSAVNTYTGDTVLNGGVLKLNGAGDISSSAALKVNSGKFDISSATGNRTVNNLSGTGGEIVLGGKTLTVNNTQSGTFAGDFDASSGSLVKEGAGTLTLTGNTAYTGDTILNAGGLTLDGSQGKAQLVSNVIGQNGTTLSLIKGATLTGTIDPTDVTIDASSRWNMIGNSSVGTLKLAGTIATTNPGPTFTQGRVLTAKNLVGQGGTINLYSVLGGNTSVTDKIVIDGGTASGKTTLAIQNAGGLGDRTTGDGINVVHAINGATTTVDAFSLANQKVLAGAYEYSLFKGGEGKGGESWFLRSQSNPDAEVNFRAEVNLYASAPRLAMDWGNASIGSLYEREGDRSSMDNPERTVWGRIVGQQGEYAGNSSGLQGNEPKSQGKLNFVQIGGDLHTWKPMEDVWARAGLFGTIGSSTDTVDNVTTSGNLGKAGTINMDHYALGAYATTQSSSGWYTDSVFQWGQQHMKTSSVNAVALGSTGNSYAASFEFGKRTDMGNNWSVEPQAQLSWQSQTFDDAADVASVVRFDEAQSALVRVGVRFTKKLGTEQSKLIAWVTPSLVNEFGRGTSVRLPSPTQGDVVANVAQGSTRMRLVGAVEGTINQDWTLSGKLGYERDVEGVAYNQTSLQVTATYRF
jgi:outer membrane autotransporter protein